MIRHKITQKIWSEYLKKKFFSEIELFDLKAKNDKNSQKLRNFPIGEEVSKIN